MRTILYSVPTGYFTRNLLRTGVIEKLLEKKDLRIVIVTPAYDDADFLKEFSFSGRIFFEKMQEVDRSYDLLDKVIWKAWSLGHRSVFFQNLYVVILKFQIRLRYYRKFHRYYKNIFDKYQPVLVVGGTPGINSRGDLPVFAEAQARGIKTLALIHSWDNIALRKGPMWSRPDTLGVWNEFQKQEALKVNFYKEEQVHLVGPPHFDIYWREANFVGRKAFFEKMGIDPVKKMVSIIATAKNLIESAYMVDIMLEAYRKNKFVLPIQILCRPLPRVDPKINDEEYRRFYADPDVIIDRQIQHLPKLGWNPDRQQLFHFANLLKYSDCVVTVASTAIIEAAILDKPVVNVAFSTNQPELFKKHITDSVFKNHFKPVLDYKATYVAKDPEEMIAGVNAYLKDPALHREERDALKKVMIFKADGKATERIRRLILGMSGYERPS